MRVITFDTLEYTEQLKAAGVPEEQAKGHAKALALVIKQVDARTDEQAAKLEERNEKQIQSRLDGLATKHEMDAKIEVAKNETIKWMVGLALAQLAMMAGILMTLVRVLPGGH